MRTNKASNASTELKLIFAAEGGGSLRSSTSKSKLIRSETDKVSSPKIEDNVVAAGPPEKTLCVEIFEF